MKPVYTEELEDPLSLAIVDLSPDFLPPFWYIHRVNTPYGHRRHGVARRLMERVLHDADAEGVRLAVELNATDLIFTNDLLEAWYLRLGFRWTGITLPSGNIHDFLVREPHPPSTV